MGLRRRYRLWRFRKRNVLRSLGQLSEEEPFATYGQPDETLAAPAPDTADTAADTVPDTVPDTAPDPAQLPKKTRPLQPIAAPELNKVKRPKHSDTRGPKSISNPILRSSFHQQGPARTLFSPLDDLDEGDVIDGLATMALVGQDHPSADFGVWETYRPKREGMVATGDDTVPGAVPGGMI